ncbi:MAG: STAS domain-containing protein [Nitrospinae bacterium]|nr:STAS domain-containing protein [Nitrospinota bacterium]MBI3814273.1 STAS domain-containing protein [Nitrospinota bacterium]
MLYRDTEVIVMESGTASIIQISGRLDYKIADMLLIKIEQIRNKGVKTIIFDLENTTFVSSLGLGIIASTRQNIKASGGEVKLTGVKGMIAEVFRITGLSKEFEIYSNLNEATRLLMA